MENDKYTSQIKIKARASEKQRWYAAAKKDGRTVSEICRAALERVSKRVDKKDTTQ